MCFSIRTLAPDEVKHACRYKSKRDDKEKTPEFRQEFNCGKSYQPSTNICPTDVRIFFGSQC